MKRCIVLILLIVFCCGCVVRVENKDRKSCFNLLKSEIKVVIPSFFSTELEDIANRFENAKQDVKISFVRVLDDEHYRTKVLDEILNKDASIFFVHGGADVNFFKNVILNLDSEKIKKLSKDSYTFKLGSYFSGLWVNFSVLQSCGLDEKNLNSLNDFLKAVEIVKKNKKTNASVVGVGEGIYSLICSLGFKEGEIAPQFETILKLSKNEDYDCCASFLNGEKVFYVGSDRHLNRETLKKEKHFKCLPLPILKNKSVIKEEDLFCLSNLSKTRKELVFEFLEFVLKETKMENFSLNNTKNSATYVMPLGLKKELEDGIKELQNSKISFDEMQNMLKRKYRKNVGLD